MPGPVLSISIIAKNEIKHLPDLFASLAHLRKRCDVQVVVADTGSNDGTAEYAREQGADVLHTEWRNDFSRARNFCRQSCRAEWIIWLDADDILPETTSEWLVDNIANLNKKNVYLFKIFSEHSDGTGSSFIQTRLFPNLESIFFTGAIHESLTPSIKAQGLLGVKTGREIIHSGYKNQEVLEIKQNRNKAVLEEIAGGKTPSLSVLFSLARQYQSEDKYPEALSLLGKIISQTDAAAEQKDVYIASHIYFGQILGFQNKLKEAKIFFEEHISVAEDNPQFLFEFAKVLFVLGEKKRAGGILARARTLPRQDWTVPTDWDSIFRGIDDVLDRVKLETGAGSPEETLPSANGEAAGIRNLISICSIVKDEEDNIEELCRQLPLKEVEWIVVDTGSSDKTVEILKRYGIVPHSFDWCDDFSAARNYSLKFAARPVIMWLDADDRLPEGFWKSLDSHLSMHMTSEGSLSKAVRFVIECARDTGEMEYFRQIRIFPNFRGVEFEGKIHEQLRTSLEKNQIEISDGDITLIHSGYFRKESRDIKLQRNFQLLQEEVKSCPEDPVVVMEFGNTFYQKKQYIEAADTYLNFLKSHNLEDRKMPPPGEALKTFPVLIANAFVQTGDNEKAVHWYKKAQQWNPDDFYPLYWLGKRALEANDVPTALSCFKEIAGGTATITNIASDQFTIQRNALGFLILCEMGISPRPDEDILGHLSALISGGLEKFPIDYKVPVEFFLSTRSFDELEDYLSQYLRIFTDDISMWEYYLEVLLERGKYKLIQELFSLHSNLKMKSGILEAFLGKSYENSISNPGIVSENKPYEIFLRALDIFPEDPTLLVSFADWVNQCKNYRQAYEDLKKIKSRSDELKKLYLQLGKLL